MPTTRTSRRQSAKKDPEDDEEEELFLSPSKTSAELICPHCEREFTTKYGLSYHVNRLVCRTEQRTSDETSDAKSVAEEPEPDSSSPAPPPKPKQKRGKKATVEEKTCPHCDSVFSSLYGLNYHLKNFVCRPDERPESLTRADSSANTGESEDEETHSQLGQQTPFLNSKKRSRDSGRLRASNNSEEEDAGDEAASLKTSQRRTKVVAAVNGDEGNESDYSEEDDDDVELDDATSASKKRQKREETFDCLHCSKSFKSSRALDYHQKNFVCRPKERPDGPVQKGRRKLENNAEKGTKYKRFRGAEEDRTCPDCGAIFTSVLGFQYHQKNKVCKMKKLNDKKPFDELPPGSRFLTSYGVVEVVADNRATPTASLPLNIPQLNKKWSKYKVQYRQYFQDRVARAGGKSLARRYQLRDHYETNSLNAASVAEIYAQDSSRTHLPIPPSFRKHQPDPAAPPESHPERIVACKLVLNRRISVNDDGADSTQVSFTKAAEMRLYMRRNELTTQYFDDMEVFRCKECGLGFHSIVGYKYHCREKVCLSNSEKRKIFIENQLATMEQRAQREIIRRQSEPQPLRVAIVPKKKVVDFPLYPQVLISLGFKLLPRSQQPVTVSAFRPLGAPRSYKSSADPIHDKSGGNEPMTMEGYEEYQKGIETQKSVKANSDKPSKKELVHPDTTMKELEWQIQLEQSKYLGSMYASVFRSLKFKPRKVATKKKPPQPIPIVIHKKKGKSRRKRKIESKPKDPLPASLLPQKPLPPFIDVRILVEELDSGRYPSIKRQPEDTKRSSKCYNCLKRAGEEQEPLHYCSFCPNTFHWSCARRKFTMKDPEPGDDLLCPKCIGIVQTRRNRAQKRRLEKLIDSDAETGRILLANEKEAIMDEVRLATETVQGREYECVASQLRRVNELTELLKDAQIRLSNHLELSRLETIDQPMIQSFERHALF